MNGPYTASDLRGMTKETLVKLALDQQATLRRHVERRRSYRRLFKGLQSKLQLQKLQLADLRNQLKMRVEPAKDPFAIKDVVSTLERIG